MYECDTNILVKKDNSNNVLEKEFRQCIFKSFKIIEEVL